MGNFKTYPIPADNTFVQQGTAVLAGFIATNESSEDILATVSGWQPAGGGSHPTCMFVKRAVQGGVHGIWFRVNFVNDHANGSTWITFYQGGNPQWPAAAGPTNILYNQPPFH